MSVIVVDASVAVKWFLAESEADLALNVLSEGDPVAAPALLKVETAAAITRRHRMAGLTREQAQDRLARSAALFASASIVFVADDELLPRAAQIALDLCHPLQDCLYIACAERAGGELITVDQTLLQRSQSLFPFVRRL